MSGLKKSRESYDKVDQEPKKKMVLFFSPAVTQIWFTFLLALHSLRLSQPYSTETSDRSFPSPQADVEVHARSLLRLDKPGPALLPARPAIGGKPAVPLAVLLLAWTMPLASKVQG